MSAARAPAPVEGDDPEEMLCLTTGPEGFSHVRWTDVATRVSETWSLPTEMGSATALIVPYDVPGVTFTAFLREIACVGPSAAMTTTPIRVRWHFSGPKESDACTVAVDLRVVYLVSMPRWRQEEPPTPEDTRRYEEFLQRLRAHEEVHVRIAARYVRRMAHELPEADCLHANATYDELYRQLRASQEAFDACVKRGGEFPVCEQDALSLGPH